MAFNLMALLSSKKSDIPAEVQESLSLAVRYHAPLELFEAPACGIRLRCGVFFNNLSQNRVVFELSRYSCPRGLRRGLQILCSFTLHRADDLWDYHKFETHITSVTQNHGRTSLHVALPEGFTQRHTRNGQRLPIGADESCTLQAWRAPLGLDARLPGHLGELLDQPPLLYNGLRGNVRLRDISKNGMGVMLPEYAPQPAPEFSPGDELLVRLVLPHISRVEPLQCVLAARLARVVPRRDGRKTGFQFTRQAIADQKQNLRWHGLDDRGLSPLADLVRERCERLKAGPLR